MTITSANWIGILLGACFTIAVSTAIILIVRREHYPPYKNKTDWQRCRGESCKAPWARSKDFGNGNCHTSENFLGVGMDDEWSYSPVKKKILRHKYGPGTEYDRVKIRMSNRHGRYRDRIQDARRSILQAASNVDSTPDSPAPPREPAKPSEPAKPPPKPPAKPPAKPPEKVVEKFPSSGRRYCYSTGSKVFAGTK